MAGFWTAHKRASDGKQFYYNMKKDVSVWELPKEGTHVAAEVERAEPGTSFKVAPPQPLGGSAGGAAGAAAGGAGFQALGGSQGSETLGDSKPKTSYLEEALQRYGAAG